MSELVEEDTDEGVGVLYTGQVEKSTANEFERLLSELSLMADDWEEESLGMNGGRGDVLVACAAEVRDLLEGYVDAADQA